MTLVQVPGQLSSVSLTWRRRSLPVAARAAAVAPRSSLSATPARAPGNARGFWHEPGTCKIDSLHMRAAGKRRGRSSAPGGPGQSAWRARRLDGHCWAGGSIFCVASWRGPAPPPHWRPVGLRRPCVTRYVCVPRRGGHHACMRARAGGDYLKI